MAFQDSITIKWESGGLSLSKKQTFTGSGRADVSQLYDAGASDILTNYSVDIGQMKSFYALSTTAMTIIPFSAGDIAQTQIDLPANSPLEWVNTSGQDNPFEDDVAYLHVSNEDGDTDGQLDIRTLVDATPTTLS
jgi:hypothetical protein